MAPATKRLQHSGLLLLGLLIALAISSLALMAMVDNWTLERQREREQELLFVGDQYRQAIRHYYYGTPPGQQRQLPTSFDDLLDDARFPTPVHHLRRLYPDPITGSTQWGELRVSSHLAGIYSLSLALPLKQAGFAPGYENFNAQERYQDWLFAFIAPQALAPTLAKPTLPAVNTPLRLDSPQGNHHD